MSPSQGLQALEHAMCDGAAQVGVTPVNWQTFVENSQANGSRPFFSKMKRSLTERSVAKADDTTANSTPESDIVYQLQQAYPNKRRPILLSHLQASAARILGLPVDNPIDRQQPLTEMGLDSLMAVELRNNLRKSLVMSLPATLLFDFPTIQALADFIMGEMFESDEPEPSNLQVDGGDSDDLLSMIEDISDDDADRLLSENLSRGQLD